MGKATKKTLSMIPDLQKRNNSSSNNSEQRTVENCCCLFCMLLCFFFFFISIEMYFLSPSFSLLIYISIILWIALAKWMVVVTQCVWCGALRLFQYLELLFFLTIYIYNQDETNKQNTTTRFWIIIFNIVFGGVGLYWMMVDAYPPNK